MAAIVVILCSIFAMLSGAARRNWEVVLWAASSAIWAAASLFPTTANAQVKVGVHLYTAHTNAEMHDSTPGIYAVWPVGIAGGRLITGVYRNSLNMPNDERRVSAYVGQAWEWGRWGLVLAGVTGYEEQRFEGRDVCPPGVVNDACWREVGLSRWRVAPLIAPSVSFPEARRLIGVTPRLTFLAAKHSALHLSLEKTF